jgi:hypothetical protein
LEEGADYEEILQTLFVCFGKSSKSGLIHQSYSNFLLFPEKLALFGYSRFLWGQVEKV